MIDDRLDEICDKLDGVAANARRMQQEVIAIGFGLAVVIIGTVALAAALLSR